MAFIIARMAMPAAAIRTPAAGESVGLDYLSKPNPPPFKVSSPCGEDESGIHPNK